MTDVTENLQEKPAVGNDTPQGRPVWLHATLADLDHLDFEVPITGSESADSNELSQLFQAATGGAAADGSPSTPDARVFNMLAAVTGIHALDNAVT